MRNPAFTLVPVLCTVGLALTPFRTLAADPDYDATAAAARKLLIELVAADTTNPPGNEARAVTIGAARLQAAGLPFQRFEFAPGREDLVARLKGDGTLRPLLLLAHVDVVGTSGQSWSTPPHQLTEVNGYLQGRGSADDLGMAAVELETFVLLAKSGVKLHRDVILAWTGDEESGGDGIRWLLKNHPELVNAEIALNEGGGVTLGKDGKPKLVSLAAAEKAYQDFTITAHGTTGHSSVPLGDNAIYRLAAGLERLSRYHFPVRLLPVTRAYFTERAAVEPPPLAAAMRAAAQAKGAIAAGALAVLERDPLMNAQLRTTCVATMLSGGTRVNALPAEATATVNCRMLPDETVAGVRKVLEAALADPGLEVKEVKDMGGGGASPVEGPLLDTIRATLARRYPGLPVIPGMSLGASDSRFLRQAGIAAYGLNPVPRSEEDSRRAHGIDERIPATSLRAGVESLHQLVLDLAAQR